LGQALRWNTELAKEWIARQNDADLYFYCDGHVRVYHGDQTALPRHYVARERLCLRATTDYWVNAMDGQPFLYVNKEVDPGLIATLTQDVVPWLEANVAKTPEQERRLAEDARAHWFTLVYDREGYSPELFAQMKKKRIAILTYRKFPQEDRRKEEFQLHSVELAGGETVNMREHYGLDHLIEYGTEPIPDAVSVVNPAWRKLDGQIRSQAGRRHRQDPTEPQVQGFQRRKGNLQEEIQVLDLEIAKLKQLRKQTEHHIPVKSLPEADRFTRLRTECKHFIDTVKMIAYRAETSMAALLREHMARGSDDARALLRQIFQTEADLTPDLAANTLTVRLHHLTQAAHDQ